MTHPRRIGPLRWLALGVWLGALACASTGDAPPPSTEGQPYRVGPPDQLQINILPEPAIERQVVVRPDGMISVDLVGDIPAAGRTTEEIGRDVETRIGRYKRDARVTVSLVQSLSTEITVLGEVNRPFTFPLDRETRLIEALGRVGGAKNFADKNDIRVIRFEDGQSRVYKVDLKAIEKGDLSSNILMRGGDIVYVPPTTLASIGYTLQMVLWPFQQLLGMGGNVSTTVVTGGAVRPF
jgi:polysaccharide export outer membrane protein